MFEGWDFADVCRTAAEIGYAGVEIAPFTLGQHPCALDADGRRSLTQAATTASVEIVGLHWLLAGTEGLHISHPDSLVRERTAQYLCDLVDLCSDVGGELVVFGSPKQRSIPAELDTQQAWANAVETVRKVIPALESSNIVLCVEPLSPEETDFLNSAEEAAEMIRELDSSNVRMILDVKAMSSEKSSPGEVIAKYGGLVGHFHANDANKRGPGFGDTDFVPIATSLSDIGYKGWVSVEVFDFSPDPVTIARDSLAYLKKVFRA